MRQADHERRRLLATSLAAVTTASGSSSWCALIGLRCPSSFIDTGSARAEWLRAPYRRHDVVDCLAGCGGVGFVVEKRLMGRVMSDTVQAVGGQCGHMFLRRSMFRIVPGVGGEDDQRFAVEAGQGRRLLHRRVRRSILLDEACKGAGGRGVGAGLVPGAWRKSGVGERVEQAAGSEVSGRSR